MEALIKKWKNSRHGDPNVFFDKVWNGVLPSDLSEIDKAIRANEDQLRAEYAKPVPNINYQSSAFSTSVSHCGSLRAASLAGVTHSSSSSSSPPVSNPTNMDHKNVDQKSKGHIPIGSSVRSAFPLPPNLPPQYSGIRFPMLGKYKKEDESYRPDLVTNQNEFMENFAVMTFGLDRLLFKDVPFVAAGGAVLAGLHRWPYVDVPDDLPVTGKDPSEFYVTWARSKDERSDASLGDTRPFIKSVHEGYAKVKQSSTLSTQSQPNVSPSKSNAPVASAAPRSLSLLSNPVIPVGIIPNPTGVDHTVRFSNGLAYWRRFLGKLAFSNGKCWTDVTREEHMEAAQKEWKRPRRYEDDNYKAESAVWENIYNKRQEKEQEKEQESEREKTQEKEKHEKETMKQSDKIYRLIPLTTVWDNDQNCDSTYEPSEFKRKAMVHDSSVRHNFLFHVLNLLFLPSLSLLCLSYIHDDDQVNYSSTLTFNHPRARTLRSFRHSDIDLFPVSRNIPEIIQGIRTVYNRLQQICPSEPIVITRSAHSLTFNMRYPYRKIQIILRAYHSIEQVISGFDIDCCSVAYDGTNVYAIPRFLRALATRQNIIDETRASTTYEYRLLKYMRRGFSVGVSHTTFTQEVARTMCFKDALTKPKKLSGLSKVFSMILLISLCPGSPYTMGDGRRWGFEVALADYDRHGDDQSDISQSLKKYKTWFNRNSNGALVKFRKVKEEVPLACGMNLEQVMFTNRCVYSETDHMPKSENMSLSARENYERRVDRKSIRVRYLSANTIAKNIPEKISFQMHCPHVQGREKILMTGSFCPVSTPTSTHVSHATVSLNDIFHISHFSRISHPPIQTAPAHVPLVLSDSGSLSVYDCKM